MSYSSPLSSCTTPGWNDPPPVLGSAKIISPGTGALANRHRRPVHPSIQASSSPLAITNPVQSVFSTPSQTATSQGPVQAATAVEFAPKQAILAPVPNYAPMDSYVPFSTTSTTAAGAATNRSFDEGKTLPSYYRPIFDAFTVPNDQAQQPMQSGTLSQVSSAPTGFPLQTADEKHVFVPSQRSFDVVSTSPPTAAVHSAPPIETNPDALIYTPPNTVGENNKRPASSPHLSEYIAPVKAAGDVSLSGFQLVQFLIKATYRLPAGVTRDGIQLRINQLQESISLGQVTDGCIKKLNFVVDALDRGLFDEAYQFFEQLQVSFPAETRTSWAQGIRLLLHELRRPTRSGSAGLARHN